MKLHEAIERLLLEAGRPLTTREIVFRINKNKWYQKKDHSPITPYQIYGRVKNYPQVFHREKSSISLVEQPPSCYPYPVGNIELVPVTMIDNKDLKLLEKVLLNEKNFKITGNIDKMVPNEPGLYCVRILNTDQLPEPFQPHLSQRNHNILYIGIASQSLKNRFLNQELRAIGHGSFFRSIGAVLGYRPEVGSLLNKANKKNYKFVAADESRIIEWLNKNTKVNWVTYTGDLDEFETGLIQRYLPLINIAKNPLALVELSELRSECVRIANQS